MQAGDTTTTHQILGVDSNTPFTDNLMVMANVKHKTQPSSGTAGFFQQPPALLSSFEEDETLKRVYKFYLPKRTQDIVSSDLSRFSRLVLSRQVRNWCSDAEINTPAVRHFDSWGRRIDELVTTEGWRKLQELGIAEGIVAIGHEPQHDQYARIYQFVKYHIWTPWNACVTCPSAMTDGAARLLYLALKRGEVEGNAAGVLQAAHSRLVSRGEDAWTSGQWMTERPGGSDVQNTETQATLSSSAQPGTDSIGNALGPYSISGFKWFSSATDANTTVLLAKEPSGVISAFFAPTRRHTTQPASLDTPDQTELNGIQIQRLKSKLGTHALPTAELILSDMRAWRIGEAGQGVKEISTVLNITRLHNAVTAVGYLGRGLAISRAFSQVRTARGSLLMDTPAHVATLAALHVEYRAMMHLAFYTSALLGLSERPPSQISNHSPAERTPLLPSSPPQILHLLRLLTPLAKALTARASISGLAECMESLGGVGYLENEDVTLNIARLFRDANVLSIWEGTTNIQADDLIRILQGRDGGAVLDAVGAVVQGCIARWKQKSWAETVGRVWEELRRGVETKEREELSLTGRSLLEGFGWIICALLLTEDALSDGDDVSADICSRWIAQRQTSSTGGNRSWKEQVAWDRRVVFGDGNSKGVARL